MTRSLIIHIGSHKTGTSSIQAALNSQRKNIEKREYVVFDKNPDGSERSNGNALPWIRFRPSTSTRIKGVINANLPQALASSGKNVIISAETFSWIFSRRQIHWLQRRLTQHFDQMLVIAYIRRQDKQALSHFQQASKQDAIVASRFYGATNRALPVFHKRLLAYLDYNQRLSNWADAFGDNNISIGIFDERELVNNDVVSDFFHRAGFDSPQRAFRENTSSGAQQTKIGHLVSAEEFSPRHWKLLMRDIDNTGKLLPSRINAKEFYENFKSSNLLLNQRFRLNDRPQIFDDDFSAYPEEGNDLWNEDTANDAIRRLLKGVRNITQLKEQERLMIANASKALRDSNPKLSTQLEKLLLNQSPEFGIMNQLALHFKSTVRRVLRRNF